MRAPPGLYQPPGFVNPYPIVHLPQLQLQKFTGAIERFPMFVLKFKAFVESQCFDDYRRLLYLQMHLVGEPANLIQSCSAYPNKSKSYSRAWELLNDRYGNSFRLRNKVKKELVSGPPIKDSDSIQLNYLATKMNSCKCNRKISKIGFYAQVSCDSNYLCKMFLFKNS